MDVCGVPVATLLIHSRTASVWTISSAQMSSTQLELLFSASLKVVMILSLFPSLLKAAEGVGEGGLYVFLFLLPSFYQCFIWKLCYMIPPEMKREILPPPQSILLTVASPGCSGSLPWIPPTLFQGSVLPCAVIGVFGVSTPFSFSENLSASPSQSLWFLQLIEFIWIDCFISFQLGDRINNSLLPIFFPFMLVWVDFFPPVENFLQFLKEKCSSL